jgi:hypothetical protein
MVLNSTIQLWVFINHDFHQASNLFFFNSGTVFFVSRYVSQSSSKLVHHVWFIWGFLHSATKHWAQIRMLNAELCTEIAFTSNVSQNLYCVEVMWDSIKVTRLFSEKLFAERSTGGYIVHQVVWFNQRGKQSIHPFSVVKEHTLYFSQIRNLWNKS